MLNSKEFQTALHNLCLECPPGLPDPFEHMNSTAYNIFKDAILEEGSRIPRGVNGIPSKKRIGESRKRKKKDNNKKGR